jgi:hypothetical protein
MRDTNCNYYENLGLSFRYGPPKEELRFNHGLFTLLEAMGQIHLFLAGKLSNLIQGGIYDLPHQ